MKLILADEPGNRILIILTPFVSTGTTDCLSLEGTLV